MEDFDNYEASGLELFHLSDIFDKLGEGIKYFEIKISKACKIMS